MEPTVLWVDLTHHNSVADRYLQQEQKFRVQLLRNGRYAMQELTQERPNIFCFEYDYPDTGGLRLLEETKRRYPSIPLLMMTEQHSEALAVWALRSRVWNYLVKPITPEVFARSVGEIVQILGHEPRSRTRKPALLRRQMPPELRFSRDPGDARNVQMAVAYVQAHYHEKISESAVAELCSLSPFRLCRAFKKELGINFRDFVVMHRIEESKRLLQNPNLSITDVAFSVGFCDAAYFSRMFRRRLGSTPSEYRALSQASLKRPEVGTDPADHAALNLDGLRPSTGVLHFTHRLR